MMTDERRFPVLWQGTHKDEVLWQERGCPRDVPWSFVAPHEARAFTNHGQSLQRLAERGGLSPAELLCVLEDRHCVCRSEQSDADATLALLERLHDWEKLSGELGLKVANQAVEQLDAAARPEEVVSPYEGPTHSPPWNPFPPGWVYMHQSEVTPEIAAWASKILNDPQTYPMHCFVQKGDFGALVQWHTFQGATGKHGLFRGVSLVTKEPRLHS